MLKKLINPDRILVGVQPAPKADLLRMLAGKLKDWHEIEDADRLTGLLVKREQMISTGVKTGFAFPHAFSPQVEKLSLTVAAIPEGTDYESLDGKPVEFVFLLIGPEQRQDVHLRVLARLSHLTAVPGILDELRKADSPSKLAEVILATDHDFDLRN